ncbi:MAG: hypothetical protein GJ676_10975 [Rhodobacteraceae bacterium]|nr:hypothetical protein [Paracoccaceae bacterium]
MTNNPYKTLPQNRFWRSAVQQSDPANMLGIHDPTVILNKSDTIVTMGSCFAQHIANWLRERGCNVPFYDATDNIRAKSFSANYGNIYTVRQAVQLLQEVQGKHEPSEPVWPAEGGFADPLRPAQFVTAFASPEDVAASRLTHLEAVRSAIRDLDVLVFTLGLTETWRIRACGTVLPTAPGVVAGVFDDERYEFVNLRYGEVLSDLEALCNEVRALREGREFRMILTVSPVPLTATASGEHILRASTYSKSVLRAVAGDFCADNDFADYFPSFELVTNPAAKSGHFEENLRSVRPDAVAKVMMTFEKLCLADTSQVETPAASVRDVDCEDALLDAFAAPRQVSAPSPSFPLLVVGNSHLASAKGQADHNPMGQPIKYAATNFLTHSPFDTIKADRFRHFEYRKEAQQNFANFTCDDARVLILVGCDFMGDGIIRANGPLLAGRPGINGREISPDLPIVDKVTPKLVAFYRPEAKRIVQLASRIQKFCDFDQVFWVAAPDMTETAARFRLGDEFVVSGAYKVHKAAYERAFQKVLDRNRGLVRFITHSSTGLSTQSGFSDDRYRANPNPWDIHCSPEFYQGAFGQIWSELMSKAAVNA